MQLRTNHNDQNESQIAFAWDDASKYSSAIEFYAKAVRMLWNDTESSIDAGDYIRRREEVSRNSCFMRQEINAAMKNTPIDEIQIDFENMRDCRSFQDDWNLKELVWRCDHTFWYMLWETAA